MSSDAMKITSSSPTLGWAVWQERVQKGSQSPTQVTSMQVSIIEITCVGKEPEWFCVPDYGFKRVAMSKGDKSQSIDACPYFLFSFC